MKEKENFSQILSKMPLLNKVGIGLFLAFLIIYPIVTIKNDSETLIIILVLEFLGIILGLFLARYLINRKK